MQAKVDVHGSGIVISDVTVVDLARWSFQSHAFVGDSFNVSCLLQGSVSADEGVIVDFSAGKKAIKQALDLHIPGDGSESTTTIASRNGFDHKLALPSDPLFRVLTDAEQVRLEQAQFSVENVSETHVRVCQAHSGEFELEVPHDSLRFIPADVLFDLDRHELSSLSLLIERHLASHLPHLDVRASLDRSPRLPMLEAIFPGMQRCTVPFRYTHGLARSASYGCQNILHGHHSFAVSADPHDALRIASYLDGAYLFNGQHRLITGVPGEQVRFRYVSAQRGTFDYRVPRNCSMERLIDVGAEPTIENIAKHCAASLRLTRPFFVSEGLQKGCFFCP